MHNGNGHGEIANTAPSSGRRNVMLVAGGSAFSAVAMYIVMMIGARTLTAYDAATLLVFIAAYQLVTGLLSGVTTELTRTMANARVSGRTDGPRVRSVIGVTSLALGAVVIASSPLWISAFPASRSALVAALTVTAIGFSGHAAMVGALGGRAAWGGAASAVSLEALVRLVGTCLAALLGLALLGFAGALAVASFAWLLLVALSPDARRTLEARTDVATAQLVRRLLAAVGALAASSLLMAGYPLLLSLTTPAREIAASPALLQAISLTRAPLLIPLMAFQTMLIALFIDHRDRAARTLAMLGAGLAAITVVGAVLAWLIGPWLMRVLFTYEIGGSTLALLTAAAGILAGISLAGALCQALEHHASFIAGWALACIVSILLLLVPGTITTRALLSLLIGPTVGLVAMAPAILASARDGRRARQEHRPTDRGTAL